MKVLVTGGAGFIGSNLTDALVRAGHQVTVLDDLSRGQREQVNDAADFVPMNICAPEISQVLQSVRPEAVFHLAAQIDVRRSVSEPIFDATVNVLGTINLLQACVDAQVPRFIFASTGGAIYGDTEIIPTPETHPPRPASGYGAAKASCEIYGNVFAQLYGLEFIALRYGNVYGPRQDPHGEAGVVAIFARKLLAGEIPMINGDGSQTRDYIHVDDVVAANLLALEASPLGAYNIGTEREVDVNQLCSAIIKATKSDLASAYGPAKPGEQRRSCLAIDKAKRDLGWQPKYSLEDGIANTIEWFTAAIPG